MPLEREKFLVYLQDENERITVHNVTIHHPDMLRGELEHNRQGAPDRGANLNLVTAWCWAAMTRMGAYAKSFPQFRDMECLGVEDDGKDRVDPTQLETPEPSA